MRFGETPIDDATGAILAHSWRANGINFAKGRRLSAEDVGKLKAAGASSVIAARLDAGDMHEDEAAEKLARTLAGEGIDVTAPFTGRCNHFAREAGLAVVDQERIDALNELHESVTVATLPPFARVAPRQMVATVKIIPYAAPKEAVHRAIDVAKSANRPLVSVKPFRPMRAGLVQTRLPGTRDKVLDKAVSTTTRRLTSLGSSLGGERRCGHDAGEIAEALGELKQEGCDIFLVAGASAIVDRHDVVPAGIERAGGTLIHFGMPVDPGNLLLTAVVMHVRDMAPGPVPHYLDAMWRMRGWQEAFADLAPVLDEPVVSGLPVLADQRLLITQAAYNWRGHGVKTLYWNPRGLRNNHYELTQSLPDRIGPDMLLLSASPRPDAITQRFAIVRHMKSTVVPVSSDRKIELHVFFLGGFLGYTQQSYMEQSGSVPDAAPLSPPTP